MEWNGIERIDMKKKPRDKEGICYQVETIVSDEVVPMIIPRVFVAVFDFVDLVAVENEERERD